MEAKIRIMDLEVDMISTDAFVTKVSEYLSDDILNIIFLLSTTMLEEATKRSEYKEVLMEADLLLPGEDTLLTMHHVEILEVGGMVIDYKCLYTMMEKIQVQEGGIYLVGSDEDKLKVFLDYCENEYPSTKIVGAYCMDIGSGTELLLNEINGLNPDIIITIIDSPYQEEWIIENKTKMNAKLCIGIGNSIDKILEERKEVPALFRMTHLEDVYHFLKNRKKMKKLQQARIFRKKVEHYKNKKGE